jgi:hypothetical protein
MAQGDIGTVPGITVRESSATCNARASMFMNWLEMGMIAS